MLQTFYLDADILIAYFSKDDKEQHYISKKSIEKIISTIERNSEIKVKIPLVILAEVFYGFFKKSILAEKSYDFEKLIKRLNADFPSPKKEHFKETLYLLDEDKLIQPHDALLVSHALLDNTTLHLFTFDKVLINNKVIEDRKQELGNKFKISAEF